MLQFTRVTTYANEGANRFSAVFRTVARQPSWITRLAMMAFVIVIMVPIVLLTLLAIVVAVVLFSVLAAGNFLYTRLRMLMPRGDGRENVRVIRRV